MKERSWNLATVLLGSLALISAFGVAAVYSAVLHRIATNAYGATGDFLSFYGAGYLVRTGRAGGLYDPAVLDWVQRKLYPGSFDEAIGYPLPVFVAWGFAPLSLLPFTASFFVFMGAMATLLAGIIVALRQTLLGVPELPRRVFLLAAACSMPAVASIVFGQVDLIALAGLLGGYLLLRSGHPRMSGLALCLVLVKPHLLIGVGLFLLCRREWRAIMVLAGVGLPLLVLPALLSAPSSLIDNVRILASYQGSDSGLSVNAATMPNWRGFVISATNSNALVLWLPGFVSIALTAITAAVWRWSKGSGLDQSYAIAVALPLLISPHVHVQSLVVLFLAGALVLRAYLANGASPDRQMKCVHAVLLAYVLSFWLPVVSIQGLSLGIFPLLAVYGAFVVGWPTSQALSAPIAHPLDAPARAA